jgi:hypothetical protein
MALMPHLLRHMDIFQAAQEAVAAAVKRLAALPATAAMVDSLLAGVAAAAAR